MNVPVDYKPVYALPEDHPEYQPWSDFIETYEEKGTEKITIGPKSDILRIQKMINEENWDGLEEEFPNFTNWRDSWRHAMKEVHKPADYDDIAIVDYERADEKWFWAHKHHLRRFAHPDRVEGKLLHQDLIRNRMFGVTSRERPWKSEYHDDPDVDVQPEVMKWGTDVPESLKQPKDFPNIHSLYSNPYESENEGGFKSKWAEKQKNKTITSKSFSFRVDQDGNTNYDWQSLWPTQSSYKVKGQNLQIQ